MIDVVDRQVELNFRLHSKLGPLRPLEPESMTKEIRKVSFCPHCSNRARQRLVYTQQYTERAWEAELEHFRFILTHSRQQPRSSCSARD